MNWRLELILKWRKNSKKWLKRQSKSIMICRGNMLNQKMIEIHYKNNYKHQKKIYLKLRGKMQITKKYSIN